MNLNLLVRGQSNSIIMMEVEGRAGAAALKREVERLLGFDGVQNTVSLVYDSGDHRASTSFSGTALIGQWLAPAGGNWTNGWRVEALEAALLQEIADLPAMQRDDPTAVLWFHSEYDSGRSGLTTAEWTSAVRFDAQLVRQALGQGAATVPYLFVSAMPYHTNHSVSNQAIRRGMEELAADPGFNGHIAARILDIDADWDDLDGNPGTREYGGGHMDAEDGMQTALRSARAIAEAFSSYALPGSPVAMANGNIADEGPEMVRAMAIGTHTLRLDVEHDVARSLAALDPDAAAGLGWAVTGPDGTVHGISAHLEDADTLIVTFSGTLPQGGRLFYGCGYGRLAGADGSARGNAVYDDQGLPIWAPAAGVEISLPQAARRDFDGDGFSDVLWRHGNGTVAVWEMSGVAFSGGGDVALNPGLGWAIVGRGDFDADGRDDILWRGADGSICIWEMDGTRVTGGGILPNWAGLDWTIAGTGDFNADGRDDILWRGVDGSICIWEMDGTRVTGGGILPNWAGLDWAIAGTGDFDGDRRDDILWHCADGSVAIWQMNGIWAVGGGRVALNPGTQWRIEGTGDYNGDGRDDILWRDTVGHVVTWEMAGGSHTGGAFLPLAPGPDWQIQA